MANKDMPLPMPVQVSVKAGEVYRWCRCGRSDSLPFCDNCDCQDDVVTFIPPYDDTLYFCNCRKSQDPPLCDGSHAKLLMEMAKNKGA